MHSPNRKIIERIIDLIDQWSKEKPEKKLIIGIDGLSGIGKTTIANEIARKKFNISVVHLDYFMNSSEKRHQAIEKFGDNLQMYENYWYDLKKFKKLISDFRNPGSEKKFVFTNDCYQRNKGPKKPQIDLLNAALLVDGIFISDKKMFNMCFDETILLTLDDEYIAKRRKLRFVINHPGEKYDKDRYIKNNFDNVWEDYLKMWQPMKNSSIILNIKIVAQLT